MNSYLVVLEVRGISPLDGGVTTDTNCFAEGFTVSGTVDVGDKLSGGTSIF